MLQFVVFLSSLYGRIERSLGCLPRSYDHKKPFIAFAHSGRRGTHGKAPKISLNWIINCNVEVIESKTGKLMSDGGRSRISKRNLFQQFVSIQNKLPYIDRDSDDSELIYAKEKKKATDFQVCFLRMQINQIISMLKLVLFTQFVVVLYLSNFRMLKMRALKHLIVKN